MNYLSLAVIGSGIAASWNYIKDIFNRIRSLFIIQITLEGEANAAILYLMWNEFERSKFGDKRFTGFVKYVNPLKKVQRIGAEKISNQSNIFWRNKRPLILTVKENSYDKGSYDERSFVTFIRGTYNFEKLLIEAFDKYNNYYSAIDISKKRGRFKIIKLMGKEQISHGYGGESKSFDTIAPSNQTDILEKCRILKYNLSDLEIAVPDNPFEGFYFDKEIQEIIEEFGYWLKSEEYFAEINVPFRRGWTLHSVPGTGKTTLIKCIAQKFDIPIVIPDLSTMNNHDLARNWKEALSHSPCIILLEDFDSQFNGRENIANKNGITFDALLNCIGGVESTEGIFTIVTTNNIKKLDPALIRSGRCGDRIIELKPMAKLEKQKLAENILKDCPQYIKEVMKNSENEVAAKFQEKCARIALNHHWNKLKN